MEDNTEFMIKNKPFALAFAIFGFIASAIIAGCFITLIIYCKIENWAIWFLLVLPAFTLVIACLGIYVYIKEKFILKNGVFTYIKVFKKAQSAPVDSIEEVIFHSNFLLVKVEFLNKKGESVISFLDDGTAYENIVFLDALTKLEIPFRKA